jgi:hypothetical protein
VTTSATRTAESIEGKERHNTFSGKPKLGQLVIRVRERERERRKEGEQTVQIGLKSTKSEM